MVWSRCLNMRLPACWPRAERRPAYSLDSDGTSQREAVRRWHQNLVLPLARLVEHELSMKLETPVELKFDKYPLDLVGRAAAFQKLVAGGIAVNEALATSGLLVSSDDEQ